MLSYDHPITLYILASTLDPVSTHNAMQRAHSPLFAQSLLPTHTFATAPDDIDVVLLPGGLGARGEESEAYMGHVVAFLRGLGLGRGEKEGSGQGGGGEEGEGMRIAKVKWILTVCTGSEILARTGALHGRRATTNKSVFGEVSLFTGGGFFGSFLFSLYLLFLFGLDFNFCAFPPPPTLSHTSRNYLQ